MVDIYSQFKDFKAFEVTFENKQGELQKIFCTVKNIENDSMILDSDNKKNKNIFADVGNELKLYIYTENGIYSASSKVLKVDKGLIKTEYFIDYPTNSKHSQRREYFRADMNVSFQMTVSPKEESAEPIIIDSITRNICGKGLSYVSDNPFPEHEHINVTLFFNERAITTNATFVYSKQIVMGNHPKFINAFAFNSISQKDIDYIVKKCFVHQLEVRKRQL